jgi:hypothetical protein
MTAGGSWELSQEEQYFMLLILLLLLLNTIAIPLPLLC